MAKTNPITVDDLREHAARFWSQVDRNGPVPPHRPELGQCWVWTGERSGKPGRQYGRFRLGKRSVGSHRVARAMAQGSLSKFACHHCDNRICCRPDHIFEGTAADNTADMMTKGRHVPRRISTGAFVDLPNAPGNYNRGEKAHFAKLTPDAVRTIRAEHANGVDASALGRRFGISETAARNVIIRKAWRHVD